MLFVLQILLSLPFSGYHQYDTALYPAMRTKGYLEFLGGFFSGNSSTVPTNESVHQKCLMTYLDWLQHILTCCEIPVNQTVDHIVAFAMHIVASMMAQRITHGDRPAVWYDEELPLVSVQRRMQC